MASGGCGSRKRPSWLQERVELGPEYLEANVPDPAAEKESENRRVRETPAYRLSRRPKRARVYTVAHESRHVLVRNVPLLGVVPELARAMSAYGPIEECACRGPSAIPAPVLGVIACIMY